VLQDLSRFGSLPVAFGLFTALAIVAARPIDSLIGAERAFSALSVAKGMRAAFLTYLADDAVVFRPGPINGKRSWLVRRDVPGVLEWAPEFVELSGAGDLGFSTGPWMYRASANAKEDHGQFVTVWRRNARGAWEVALDCGTSHPRPEHGPPEVKVREGPGHAPPDSNAWKRSGFEVGAGMRRGGTSIGVGTGAGVSVGSGGLGLGVGLFNAGVRSRADYEYRRTAHEKNQLMAAERTLTWHARKSGWERAFREVSAGDLRTDLDGAPPVLGPDAAAAAFQGQPREATWEYRGNGVAKSWDLGYAYGLMIARARGAARPDTGAFAHLWRKDDTGQWRMVIAWESPFPKRK